MISQAGQWTQTLSTTCLQPKKWNAHILIMFNFWWLAGLVNGLEKKWNACFWIMFASDDLPGWLMNSNPICHPSPTKEWNAQFLITFNFWWPAGLVNGPEPHPPCLSSQKHEMLIFGFCSTSDDQPGWSMDSNPICHPSPAKKVKCSFLYYNQLLI